MLHEPRENERMHRLLTGRLRICLKVFFHMIDFDPSKNRKTTGNPNL